MWSKDMEERIRDIGKNREYGTWVRKRLWVNKGGYQT